MVNTTSCSPGTSLTCGIIIRYANRRLLGPDSAYLEGVVLKNILNVLDRGFQVFQPRRLLVLQLVLQLSSKLNITCETRNKWLAFSAPTSSKDSSDGKNLRSAFHLDPPHGKSLPSACLKAGNVEKAAYDGLAICFNGDCHRDLETVDPGRSAADGVVTRDRENVRGTDRASVRSDIILQVNQTKRK